MKLNKKKTITKRDIDLSSLMPSPQPSPTGRGRTPSKAPPGKIP